MEIASDAQGIIWATTFSSGLLVRFDPVTTRFTSYQAPSTGAGVSALSGLLVSPTGDIWITIFAGNRLARLDQRTRRFVSYLLPTRVGEPAAMTMDAHHHLWFAELDAIGVLGLQTGVRLRRRLSVASLFLRWSSASDKNKDKRGECSFIRFSRARGHVTPRFFF